MERLQLLVRISGAALSSQVLVLLLRMSREIYQSDGNAMPFKDLITGMYGAVATRRETESYQGVMAMRFVGKVILEPDEADFSLVIPLEVFSFKEFAINGPSIFCPGDTECLVFKSAEEVLVKTASKHVGYVN